MANKGYIYRGAKPVYWSWFNSPLLKQRLNTMIWFQRLFTMRTKLKMVRVSLDTDTCYRCLDNNPFTVYSFSQTGLTVGAEFDYVVVKPAGSGRKYVVASIFAKPSENSG